MYPKKKVVDRVSQKSTTTCQKSSLETRFLRLLEIYFPCSAAYCFPPLQTGTERDKIWRVVSREHSIRSGRENAFLFFLLIVAAVLVAVPRFFLFHPGTSETITFWLHQTSGFIDQPHSYGLLGRNKKRSWRQWERISLPTKRLYQPTRPMQHSRDKHMPYHTFVVFYPDTSHSTPGLYPIFHLPFFFFLLTLPLANLRMRVLFSGKGLFGFNQECGCVASQMVVVDE